MKDSKVLTPDAKAYFLELVRQFVLLQVIYYLPPTRSCKMNTDTYRQTHTKISVGVTSRQMYGNFGISQDRMRLRIRVILSSDLNGRDRSFCSKRQLLIGLFLKTER